MREQGLEVLTGALDGGGHRHVALEGGVGLLAPPAGDDQLGPDREAQPLRLEEIGQRATDGGASLVEVREPVDGVVGLDLDEDVDGEVPAQALTREVDDAPRGKGCFGAADAGGNDLAARGEQHLGDAFATPFDHLVLGDDDTGQRHGLSYLLRDARDTFAKKGF